MSARTCIDNHRFPYGAVILPQIILDFHSNPNSFARIQHMYRIISNFPYNCNSITRNSHGAKAGIGVGLAVGALLVV